MLIMCLKRQSTRDRGIKIDHNPVLGTSRNLRTEFHQYAVPCKQLTADVLVIGIYENIDAGLEV
jgi:hypothetical protein